MHRSQCGRDTERGVTHSCVYVCMCVSPALVASCGNSEARKGGRPRCPLHHAHGTGGTHHPHPDTWGKDDIVVGQDRGRLVCQGLLVSLLVPEDGRPPEQVGRPTVQGGLGQPAGPAGLRVVPRVPDRA